MSWVQDARTLPLCLYVCAFACMRVRASACVRVFLYVFGWEHLGINQNSGC